MKQEAIRYACRSDLNKYFKKIDLLGGLNVLEQAQLRRNIGIVEFTDPGDVTQVSKLKYSLLKDLVDTNQLIPGKKYIITDFQTIYPSNVRNNKGEFITWGIDINETPIIEIVITAVTNNRFDPRIIYNNIESNNWHIEYDFTQQVLEDGKLTKGKITYLKDSNNNSAYYDFKNIKFRRTSDELKNSNFKIDTTYMDFYTFSDVNDGVVCDSSFYHNTKNNNINEGSYNNVFLGDTFNNVIEEDCINNTFIRGCHDTTIKWNSVNNLFNENVCYTEGSIYNKIIKIGDTNFSTSINKTICKVNDATILSFLDPITYSHQIIIL